MRPPNRSRIRPRSAKYLEGSVGGEWNFTYRGRAYSLPGRWINDPISADGMRWIVAAKSKPVLTQIVAELASLQCELKISKGCWGWTPLGHGHRHHEIHKKMGGAHTEDRIWVNGVRVAFWTCFSCHRDEHNPLYWTKKEQAA